jgi:hypothetical protein
MGTKIFQLRRSIWNRTRIIVLPDKLRGIPEPKNLNYFPLLLDFVVKYGKIKVYGFLSWGAGGIGGIGRQTRCTVFGLFGPGRRGVANYRGGFY